MVEIQMTAILGNTDPDVNESTRILCSCNAKVAQKPFSTFNNVFAKPKDPMPKEQKSDAMEYIRSRAMTVIRSTSDRLNVSMGHV